MSLTELISSKRELQKKLIDIISNFISKYIIKLHAHAQDQKSPTKTFQQSLVDIAIWTDDDIVHQYKKFIKWSSRKYNTNEDDMQHDLHMIISMLVRMMLYKYDYESVLTGYTMPSLQYFFYKSMTRVARYYYENPSLASQPGIETKVSDLVCSTLNKALPLKDIFKYIETIQDDTSANIPYDFQKETTSHDDSQQDNKVPLIVEKKEIDDNNDDKDLKYVSSEELYKEYYMSENDEPNTKPNGEPEERHIQVPVVKKPGYNRYNKK